MELLDDLVDVPKQPKVKESFLWFFTKRETLYLAVFLAMSVFSVRLPLGLILNTFVFGLIFFVGIIFTFHRYRGRNFDRWVFDYVLFKVKTLKGHRLLFNKDYKFSFTKRHSAAGMVWWKKILCTMPVFGPIMERYLVKEVNLIQEDEETEEDVFSTFEADFEMDDVEEQIKGILNVHFFYEWQDAIMQDKSLEYADASRLLLTLENIIEKHLNNAKA